MNRLIFAVLFLLLLPAGVMAGNETASSCSASDIQSAIDTCIAGGGGVITIPACDYTNSWGASDSISVVSDIAYYIRGAGSSSTKIGYADNVAHSGYMWQFRGAGFKELSGIYMEGNYSTSTYQVDSPLRVWSYSGASRPTNSIIYDIITKNFSVRSKFCHTTGLVVYNCTFHQVLDAGQYHFDVYDDAAVDWEEDGISFPDDFGTNNFNVFFEGNTFYGAHHPISTFVRAKVVVRYNNFIVNPEQIEGDNQGNLDAHDPGWGCCSDDNLPDANSWYHGGQAYEIYNNHFTRTGAHIGGGYAVRIRSGAAIITKNYFENQGSAICYVLDSHSAAGGLCDSGHGWAQDHSIVYGHSPSTSCDTTDYCCDKPDPGYIWDNSYNNNDDNFTEEGATAGISENVDYFFRAPTQVDDGFTWSAYTCPHPLTGLTGSCDDTLYGTEGYNVDGGNPSIEGCIISGGTIQ